MPVTVQLAPAYLQLLQNYLTFFKKQLFVQLSAIFCLAKLDESLSGWKDMR
jgi:hypothetical protein